MLEDFQFFREDATDVLDRIQSKLKGTISRRGMENRRAAMAKQHANKGKKTKTKKKKKKKKKTKRKKGSKEAAALPPVPGAAAATAAAATTTAPAAVVIDHEAELEQVI